MTDEIASDEEFAALWCSVGVEAAWQVTDLQTGRTLGTHVDEPMPLASVAKVVVALAAERLADRAELDLSTQVTLAPDGRSTGTTGISAMRDPVTLSLRDAGYLALTISDNAASDALWDSMPAGAVQRELDALALTEISIGEPMRDVYDRIARGVPDPLDVPTLNTGTPRDLIVLLESIWADHAASPSACARLRDLMRRQIWQERLASAFPAPDIEIAGKTGTLQGLRHEIGVVTYPQGRAYGVAILTNALTCAPDHRTDHVIGEVARRAIVALRRAPG